jgi:hypothetical protein
MNGIHGLQKSYLMTLAGIGSTLACIDWAIAQIGTNDEPKDQDVLSLAATNDKNEAIKVTEQILTNYLGGGDPSVGAGKHLVLLHQMYRENQLSIVALADVISTLYSQLGNPDWLAMLSRNCDYATDIPDFLPAFQAEFDYITGLWSQADSSMGFLKVYDRNTSNSHNGLHA